MKLFGNSNEPVTLDIVRIIKNGDYSWVDVSVKFSKFIEYKIDDYRMKNDTLIFRVTISGAEKNKITATKTEPSIYRDYLPANIKLFYNGKQITIIKEILKNKEDFLLLYNSLYDLISVDFKVIEKAKETYRKN